MSSRPAGGGTGPLDWDRDGRDWPHREASQFVEAGGLRWHLQRMGSGPVALLLHGTGAATHSWRGLAPLLAEHFTVVAPDLPGHGFSGRRPRAGQSLPAMAEALGGLLERLGLAPALGVGHSAGAAILARMTLDRRLDPGLLVGLNAALLPLRGLAGHLFSPAARLLALNPLVPRLFAWRMARPGAVERLLADTGSRLEPEGVELYRRVVCHPGHVAAALDMMAHWNLESLARELPRLRPAPLLLVGGGDRTVRPTEARRVRQRIPGARVAELPGLGHLAHEQRPDLVAERVRREAAAAGVGEGRG